MASEIHGQADPMQISHFAPGRSPVGFLYLHSSALEPLSGFVRFEFGLEMGPVPVCLRTQNICLHLLIARHLRFDQKQVNKNNGMQAINCEVITFFCCNTVKEMYLHWSFQ